MVVPTEGLLVPVQSLKEALADKFIALAYRARRIKPRDVWDIVWIAQRGVGVSAELVDEKLAARSKTRVDFTQALEAKVHGLLEADEVRQDFYAELSRFVPSQIKARTLDNPEYWGYVQAEVKRMATQLVHRNTSRGPFDMGF